MKATWDFSEPSLKPEKPARMTKQRGTVALQKLVTKAPEQPMETETILSEDVEMCEVPEPVSAIPLSRTKKAVDDIDADDRGNPQLAVEYVNEIYEYMRQLEFKLKVKEDYLNLIEVKGEREREDLCLEIIR